jgi:hypothetical protein
MQHTKRVNTVRSRIRKPKGGKRCPYRKFPYLKVAKMWARGKTIAQIAHSINRVDKHNAKDPYHSLRNFLYRMHNGYLDGNGQVVRLPHRVSAKMVRAGRKAGLRSARS